MTLNLKALYWAWTFLTTTMVVKRPITPYNGWTVWNWTMFRLCVCPKFPNISNENHVTVSLFHCDHDVSVSFDTRASVGLMHVRREPLHSSSWHLRVKWTVDRLHFMRFEWMSKLAYQPSLFTFHLIITHILSIAWIRGFAAGSCHLLQRALQPPSKNYYFPISLILCSHNL